jgi:hypothetical protein
MTNETPEALVDLWEASDDGREYRLACAWLNGGVAEVYGAARDAARNEHGVVNEVVFADFMLRIVTRARRLDAYRTRWGVVAAYHAALDSWLADHPTV